jgi:hypothetical protein
VNDTGSHLASVPLQSLDAVAAVQSDVHSMAPPPMGKQMPVAQSSGLVHAAPKPSAPVGVGPHVKSTRFAPESLAA